MSAQSGLEVDCLDVMWVAVMEDSNWEALRRKFSEGQLCKAVCKGEMGHALPKNLLELSYYRMQGSLHIVERTVESSCPAVRKEDNGLSVPLVRYTVGFLWKIL